MRCLKTISIRPLFCFPLTSTGQSSDIESIRPSTGQPAADVLGFHDLLGNQTFVGGITNKRPDSQSTW